ncbi:Small heat shock protein chloroplastic [Bienertia sinuspersici]
MASMALQQISGKDLVSGAFSRPLRALSATRGFNNNGQMTRVDDHSGGVTSLLLMCLIPLHQQGV